MSAQGTVQVMMEVDAARATGSVTQLAAALREAEAAQRAQATAAEAANRWLEAEAVTAREDAAAQAALAAAKRRLQDIAVSNDPAKAQALATRRAWEELSTLAQKTQDTALVQQAAAAIAARSKAGMDDLADAGMRAAASSGQLEFAAKNLRFQLADMFTQAAGGTNPLLILAQQGPDVAYSFMGAAKASDVLRATFGMLIPSAATVQAALAGLVTFGPVIVAAMAAAAAAYAVVGNRLADMDDEARKAGPSLDTLTQRADESAAAAGKLSSAWAKVDDAFKDAQTQIDILTGAMTANIAKANEQIATLRRGEAGKALLADARAKVEAEQALTKAIEEQNKGNVEAGAKVEKLRENYNRATATLDAHKQKLEETELLIWGAAAATDAKEAADKAASAAAKDHTAALREQEQVLRLLERVDAISAKGMEERARATAEAAMEIGKLEAEARKLGVSATAIQPAIDAINKALRSKLTGFDIADATKAFDALPVPVNRAADVLKSFNEELQDIVPERALTDMERLQALQADLSLAFSQGALDAIQYADAMQRVAEATDAAQAAKATQVVGGMTSAEGVLSTVGAATGPWGQLIVTIIDAVKNLDETIASIEDLIGGVLEQVGKLPETFGKVMEYAQKDLPKQIGAAIGGLIAGLPDMLATAIVDILNPMTLFQVFGRFFDALLRELGISADFLKSLNDAVEDVGKWFRDLWNSIKDALGIGKSSQKEDLMAQSESRQNSLYAGTSRTTSGAEYTSRRAGWGGAEVSRAAAMGGPQVVRMGGTGGRLTFTIDEGSYADVHKTLKKRGVLS